MGCTYRPHRHADARAQTYRTAYGVAGVHAQFLFSKFLLTRNFSLYLFIFEIWRLYNRRRRLNVRTSEDECHTRNVTWGARVLLGSATRKAKKRRSGSRNNAHRVGVRLYGKGLGAKRRAALLVGRLASRSTCRRLLSRQWACRPAHLPRSSSPSRAQSPAEAVRRRCAGGGGRCGGGVEAVRGLFQEAVRCGGGADLVVG